MRDRIPPWLRLDPLLGYLMSLFMLEWTWRSGAYGWRCVAMISIGQGLIWVLTRNTHAPWPSGSHAVLSMAYLGALLLFSISVSPWQPGESSPIYLAVPAIGILWLARHYRVQRMERVTSAESDIR